MTKSGTEELTKNIVTSASTHNDSPLGSSGPTVDFRGDFANVISDCMKVHPNEALRLLQEGMSAVGEQATNSIYSSLAPLLPLILKLRGEPYTLKNHFMMFPIFKAMRPWELILKCGRQVSKSTSLAALSIALTTSIPFLTTLFVLPLYEMTRRFSNNYVKTLIDDSSVKHLLVDSSCDQNVLQRTFLNHAMMIFSFAFLDASRIRGIAADSIIYDECASEKNKILSNKGGKMGYTILSDLQVGDHIFGHSRGKLVKDRVINIVHKGVRPTWRVTLANGHSIECTENEKILTKEHGWVYLKEIIDVCKERCLGIKAPSTYRICKASGIRGVNLKRKRAISQAYQDKAYLQEIPNIHVRTSKVLPGTQIEEHDDEHTIYGSNTQTQTLVHETKLTSSKIVSIEYAGEQEVVDVETEKYHTLIIEGFAVHNCQDLDFSFLPVINETISASKWGLKQYSGTPKSYDNTIQALWERSSQAEWCIRCDCSHWNIPAVGFDIHDMIGPVKNISKYGTALLCAKCRKPINSTTGVWVHQYPDRFNAFSGYHVPQIILPHHYASEKNWTLLLAKRDGGKNAEYLNECLGESCDVGLKLITLDELKSSCILPPNDYHKVSATDITKKYVQVILGVDWGGRGEKETSYTTIAVVGLTPDFKMEAIYLERLQTTVNDVEEVKRILEVYKQFKCQFIAHDYAGAGSVHETLLIQAGFPELKIIPFNYMHVTAKPMISVHNADSDARHYYVLDKARSVLLLATLLKTHHLSLPEYASCISLVEDFLHIYKETQETYHRGSMLMIKRVPNMADDIVHAINFACCGHYHTTQKYPDIAASFGLSATPSQLAAASPAQPEYDL